MTDQHTALARIFAACWKDDELKERFVSDPKTVMKEFDLEVPEGLDVKVVENTETTAYITLPHAPLDSSDIED